MTRLFLFLDKNIGMKIPLHHFDTGNIEDLTHIEDLNSAINTTMGIIIQWKDKVNREGISKYTEFQ